MHNSSTQYLDKLARRFPGKRAFITGAGSGLGLAFATDLARDNWKLALTDIDEQRLNDAVKAVRTAGGEAISYTFDVSNYEQFAEAVNDFQRRHGGIDIGINNAGIGCGGYLHEMRISDFRKVIDVNLMGVVNGCHLFVPIMKNQRNGYILNVASAAAFVTAPRMSAYNTAKAGVVALSETLRAELCDDAIGVSVLMPTYVRTNIGNDALGSAEDNKLAQLFVNDSKLSAEAVASATLRKVSENHLYVVMPRDAIILWRFKRHLPNVFWRFISKAAKDRSERLMKRALRD
ncbi:SDR family NAD(P)-dependent oxidoreductase [Candidatus Obscuribacterales bacterium]|nr:SDR family NAD(P)-dependent oxidoreductase [Candidatus Obscuribacterales bacterium]MBX3149803.1 SDR family NAD(P)-dependent oxidoreductase [Candidatus Obscuribacterales bacterium]